MPDNESDGESEHARHILRCLFREDGAFLHGIICSYITRMGLASGAKMKILATEVLHDTAIEALSHADRLESSMQPRAWVLAIAANILKRKRSEAMKQQRREIFLSDLKHAPNATDESDMFDILTAFAHPAPEEAIEANEQAREILSLVAPADQDVLRLAVVHDMDTASVARELGVSSGTARVRLHRALQRLRKAWLSQKSQER